MSKLTVLFANDSQRDRVRSELANARDAATQLEVEDRRKNPDKKRIAKWEQAYRYHSVCVVADLLDAAIVWSDEEEQP